MEKIWIKKELYILNYEFLKFYAFFRFLYNFKLIFPYLNRKKRGYFGPQNPVADVARVPDVARADVACGTTARMRRGFEATWQGRGWPTRGAGGAQDADAWQEAKRSTRVHVGAHVGCHVAGRAGRWRAHGYSGPW